MYIIGIIMNYSNQNEICGKRKEFKKTRREVNRIFLLFFFKYFTLNIAQLCNMNGDLPSWRRCISRRYLLFIRLLSYSKCNLCFNTKTYIVYPVFSMKKSSSVPYNLFACKKCKAIILEHIVFDQIYFILIEKRCVV